jgi:hypothetical protein
VKGFFNDAVPQARDILLIESGSPEVLRRALPPLRRNFPEARLHLCTCWPDPVPGVTSVFQATDYPSWSDKVRLLFSFRKRRWEILAVVCSNESIMFAWKVLALVLMPSKTLVINEHGDYFWLDWLHRRALRGFLATRWVFIRRDFLLAVLRALVFPLTVLYLLATALLLYLRRWYRLVVWRIHPPSAQRREFPPHRPAS